MQLGSVTPHHIRFGRWDPSEMARFNMRLISYGPTNALMALAKSL
jgi:hypothetical protein